MTPRETILIVEDNRPYRDRLAAALTDEFEVLTASTVEQARRRIDQGVAVVLCDVRLDEQDPSNRAGLKLVEDLAPASPAVPFIVLTGYGDIDTAVQAMKIGAADFIQKDSLDLRELAKIVHHNLARYRLTHKVASLEDELRRLEPWELVGDDPKVHETQRLVDLVASDGYCSVLVCGETGTGKELVARAIHSRGWRKAGPFVAVTLPALARDVVESELFGHTRGAFTGAQQARAGYIEKANGGVLFLDEIGELHQDIQVKLLRVLETRKFARVGSTDEITVDLQVVAATNRDMDSAVRQGLIREDLYFRIKTVQIDVPPLRQRPDDIPLLVDHFLFLFRQQGRTRLAGVSPEVIRLLATYPFPGNVRELRSMVERAMILAHSRSHKLIEPDDLPLDVVGGSPGSDRGSMPVVSIGEGVNLDEALARFELGHISEALKLAEGRKTDAWKLLGLNDRFALRRRVNSIKEHFPQLIGEFPTVSALYP